MELAELKSSLSAEKPPRGLSPPLKALWWAARGDWDEAHKLAQERDGKAASLVHAYLHRVEGDESNAAYWYRRAGRKPASGPLPAEWDAIAEELL